MADVKVEEVKVFTIKLSVGEAGDLVSVLDEVRVSFMTDSIGRLLEKLTLAMERE